MILWEFITLRLLSAGQNSARLVVGRLGDGLAESRQPLFACMSSPCRSIQYIHIYVLPFYVYVEYSFPIVCISPSPSRYQYPKFDSLGILCFEFVRVVPRTRVNTSVTEPVTLLLHVTSLSAINFHLALLLQSAASSPAFS